MKVKYVICLIVCVFAFNSCRVGSNVKIGFLIHSLQNSRWQSDLKFLKEKAESYGAELIVRDANNDENEQLKQAEELVKEGVDVLIVVPANQNTAAGIVRLANDNNVPVISYDRLIRNAEISCLLSFDYVDVGKQMVDYAVSKKSTGNYVFLWGDASDANARFISEGHEKAIKPYVESGKIKILYKQYIEDYSVESTFQAIKKVCNFSSEPIDAVICGSGAIAETVAQYFDDGNYTKHIIVIGQDLSAKTSELMAVGKLDMSVYKPVKDLAEEAINVALDLAKRGHLREGNYKYVNNGRSENPAILLPSKVVTSQNLSEYFDTKAKIR